VPPDFAGTQPAQQSVPTHATPATQPRSATHYRHPITNNLIRRPPPTLTDLLTDTRQFNQTPFCVWILLEPHTSLFRATIAAVCLSELQRRATQNALTPSSIQTFPPDANARPRKRTACNNIPHTGPSQTQHHPTIMMPAAPPITNPTLTTLLTNKLQPNKKKPLCMLNVYTYHPPICPNYSHWMPALLPSLPLPHKPASKTCTADTICSPKYHEKEKTQPDSKPATSPPHAKLNPLCRTTNR